MEAQDAVREQAQVAYEQAVLTALQEVENALVALARNRERGEALTRAAEAAHAAAHLARQRYGAGVIDFQSVIDTERTVLSVEDSLASTRADGVLALIRLYKALGGGWSQETEPHPAGKGAHEATETSSSTPDPRLWQRSSRPSRAACSRSAGAGWPAPRFWPSRLSQRSWGFRSGDRVARAALQHRAGHEGQAGGQGVRHRQPATDQQGGGGKRALAASSPQVLVDENDRVKKGQVLAQLDLAKLKDAVTKSRATLAAAEAQVLQAQATMEEARAQLARFKQVAELSGGKVPSKSELATAEANLKRAEANEASARASVTQARANLQSDETNLGKASIRSPIDGVVLTRKVEPGQTVAAALQAPVLFTLAEDLAKMKLQVDVDEADVGQVRVGQTATFTVDAWPGRKYTGVITRVGYGSQTKDNVVSYPTVLAVSNDDLSLRPGMTGTADIVTVTRENVLLVPNAALRFTPRAAGAPGRRTAWRHRGQADAPPAEPAAEALCPCPTAGRGSGCCATARPCRSRSKPAPPTAR